MPASPPATLDDSVSPFSVREKKANYSEGRIYSQPQTLNSNKMAKLLCAFVVVALMAVTADALKCYECPLGCQGTDKSKWSTQECGATTNQKKMCLKQVITIPGSPDRVIRKCALIPDGKTKYECVDSPGEKTTSCETCSDDLCNSAGSVTFSFLAFASVILPFLASKFFVH